MEAGKLPGKLLLYSEVLSCGARSVWCFAALQAAPAASAPSTSSSNVSGSVKGNNGCGRPLRTLLTAPLSAQKDASTPVPVPAPVRSRAISRGVTAPASDDLRGADPKGCTGEAGSSVLNARAVIDETDAEVPAPQSGNRFDEPVRRRSPCVLLLVFLLSAPRALRMRRMCVAASALFDAG